MRFILPSVALLAASCGLNQEGGLLSLEAKNLVFDQEEANAGLARAAAIAALPALTITASHKTLAQVIAAQVELGQKLSATCLQLSSDSNVVTYTLSGCSGPWGSAPVSGMVSATFSPGTTEGGFRVELLSVDLTVAERAADLAGALEISVSEGARTIQWQGAFATSLADGRELSHQADIELVLDGERVDLAGSLEATVGTRKVRFYNTALSRLGPAGTCPEGSLTIDRGPNTLSVDLEFDGTTEYLAKTSRGGRGSFDLVCKPAASP